MTKHMVRFNLVIAKFINTISTTMLQSDYLNQNKYIEDNCCGEDFILEKIRRAL